MQQLRPILVVILAAASVVMVFTSSASAQQNCGFENWDQSDDTYLDIDEFTKALDDEKFMDRWDLNKNGSISESEWDAGVEVHLRRYDPGAYGYYNDWDDDQDGVLTDDEFNDELFDTVEENDSNTIEENEWDTFDVLEDGVFC